ncbi:MAG: TolC family protein [Bacteroidales bacterium]|nr:TolC family protein [Bacteroidales bacterium]
MKLFLSSMVIIILFNIQDLKSQEFWSLDDCLNYALENNIQLKRQELASKISENNYFQSLIDVAPDLVGFGRHNFSSGKTVNLEDYTYINTTFYDGYMGAQSQLTLFNGFQKINTIRQSKFNLLGSIEDIGKAKNDLVLNITGAYLQILFNHELLEVATGQLEVTGQQVDRTSKMVELGKISKGELLEIQSQAAAEKLNVTNAQNQLILSYLSLIQLLRLDSIGDFKIIKPENIDMDKEILITSVRSVYEYAKKNFPQIKSAEYNLKSLEKDLAIARGQRSPQINLTGTMYSRYSELAHDPLDPTSTYALNKQLSNNLYKQVSVNLNVPIFNRWLVQNRISNAKINVLDAIYNLDQNKQILYQEIQQAHADALAALEKYHSSFEAVESREEAFYYTQQKFNVGLTNSVDYNIAKNNLTRARSDLLQAKYEFIFKSKILDFYQGNPISL